MKCNIKVSLTNQTAYKGFLINTHPLTGQIWISKNGQLIGYAISIPEAKTIIDNLAD